jgi:hypothetical protein
MALRGTQTIDLDYDAPYPGNQQSWLAQPTAATRASMM